MDYTIKEIEKEDLYDYMNVSTYSMIETYKGIMADEFLDKIENELNKNVEENIITILDIFKDFI